MNSTHKFHKFSYNPNFRRILPQYSEFAVVATEMKCLNSFKMIYTNIIIQEFYSKQTKKKKKSKPNFKIINE